VSGASLPEQSKSLAPGCILRRSLTPLEENAEPSG
jgi:hypothetical protein